MGKKKGRGNSDYRGKKRREAKDQSNKCRKRRKFLQKFWIESCKENKVPKSVPPHMVIPVTISRVELIDNHIHVGLSTETKEEDEGLADNDLTAKYEGIPTPLISQVILEDKRQAQALETKESVEMETVSNITKPFTSDNRATPKRSGDKMTITTANDQIQLENEKCGNDSPKPANIMNRESNETDKSAVDEETNGKKPFVRFIKSPSAKGRAKIIANNFKDLPDGNCGDGIVNPFRKDEVADKYWAQRKRLFSKFDEGLQLDRESWYSVTPEAIAEHIAARVVNMFDCGNGGGTKKRGVILDAFCGVGGNAIGFANDRFKASISLIICVDTVREKLEMAAHNASIYGVDTSRMLFIEGNAAEVLQRYNDGKLSSSEFRSSESGSNKTCKGYKIGGYDLLPPAIDVVFLSPPWGGMSYLEVGKSGYTLSKCISVNSSCSNEDASCNGEELLSLSANASRNKSVVYFLPRNVDGISTGFSAWKVGYRHGFEMEQNYLNGKLKTVTMYFKDASK